MKAFAAPHTARARRRADPGPAIDLVHLSRQSMGDAALERELLDMFDRQSARLVAQLMEAEGANFAARANLAHKLRGSALALGAARVASAAAAFEDCCVSASEDCEPLARALAEAVGEARAEIGRLAQ